MYDYIHPNVSLNDMQATPTINIFVHTIRVHHFLKTNLEPRRGLPWPNCRSRHALVARDFGTAVMSRRGPALYRLYWIARRCLAYPPYLLRTYLVIWTHCGMRRPLSYHVASSLSVNRAPRVPWGYFLRPARAYITSDSFCKDNLISTAALRQKTATNSSVVIHGN